jgi:hypothetical protein
MIVTAALNFTNAAFNRNPWQPGFPFWANSPEDQDITDGVTITKIKSVGDRVSGTIDGSQLYALSTLHENGAFLIYICAVWEGQRRRARVWLMDETTNPTPLKAQFFIDLIGNI